MKWQIALSSDRLRVAIFVSKYDHCLVDLLYRWHTGELACEIPLIVSNHPEAKRHADFYGLLFHLMEVTKENKLAAERRERELLDRCRIDLIVLARYMQILSPEFIASYPQRIINIHHSFLPAFLGAKPHHQAFERGVKLLGATAHYTANPEILWVARRISLGFCLAMVLLEVPEGRHKVAHRASGGEAHKQVPKPRRGGTCSQGCVAPAGLDALPKPSPTTSVVGYVVSSLRDWAGGCSRPAVTTGKNSGLATTVGFGCGSAAL